MHASKAEYELNGAENTPKVVKRYVIDLKGK